MWRSNGCCWGANMVSGFGAMVRRDLLLTLRAKGDLLTLLFFFIVVTTLFPLAIGPELKTLRLIAAGIVWVAALLSSMLALERLFAQDYLDGTLEQLALSGYPLALLVLAKIVAHWLTTALPLVVLAPVVGIQYGLESHLLGVLALSLLLGSPALSAIGAIGAALTLGLRGGGALVSLLVLPLVIPVLIFGAGAVEAELSGLGGEGHLNLLIAFTLLSLFFAPMAAALSLKVALD